MTGTAWTASRPRTSPQSAPSAPAPNPPAPRWTAQGRGGSRLLPSLVAGEGRGGGKGPCSNQARGLNCHRRRTGKVRVHSRLVPLEPLGWRVSNVVVVDRETDVTEPLADLEVADAESPIDPCITHGAFSCTGASNRMFFAAASSASAANCWLSDQDRPTTTIDSHTFAARSSASTSRLGETGAA